MKPKQLTAPKAIRFGRIVGFDLISSPDDALLPWGIFDLEDCDIYTDKAFASAREAAYDLAKDLIKRSRNGINIGFDEDNHHHHHAMHEACNRTLEHFKGIKVETDANFKTNIEEFLQIYHTECLEREAGLND